MIIWIVSWNGDQDCGGRNDGPIAAFRDRESAVAFILETIGEPLWEGDRYPDADGPWIGPDEDYPNRWDHYGEREMLLLTELELPGGLST